MEPPIDVDIVRAALERIHEPSDIPLTAADVVDVADLHEAASKVVGLVESLVSNRFRELSDFTIELQTQAEHFLWHWNSLTSRRMDDGMLL